VQKLLVSLAAASLALAQAPHVGPVELYGVRKVSEERLRAAIGLQAGDTLPASKADIEERVERVPGVLRGQVEAVCCTGNAAVLYVGIEEREAPHVEFHPAPAGAAGLPQPITAVYGDFVDYFGAEARVGNPTGPAADTYRGTFEHLAQDNAAALRHVLRESDEPDERAIAAWVLRYAPVTKEAVADLQYAMLDDDRAVRSNAMRSLLALAPRAAADPDLGVRIEITWFVELLNSLDWDDRHEAAEGLVALTAGRDPSTLDLLRDRALAALADMARWKTPEHAHAAFVLLGRTAGLSEPDIEAAWNRGDRDAVLKQKAGAKRPRP
jgi:hypothetical protein